MILNINDRIRNRQLTFFNQFKLSLRYDSVASPFSFSYFFDPDNIEHKELSCIGHYHLCTLQHNNETLVTGQVLSINFNDAPTKTLVNIGGYALPGVLEDSDIPDSLGLQTEGLSLQQIAQRICEKFNLKLVVDAAVQADAAVAFSSSAAKEGQNCRSYLSELAKQKDIVLSHTPQGALLLTRPPVSQTPILQLDKANGLQPATRMRLQFNGQAMHSHLIVRGQADTESGEFPEAQIRNPYVFPQAVYRPKYVTLTSGTDADADKVARQALAAELKEIKLTVELDRWVLNGAIIRPGKLITVRNPDVYLYKESTWFIEQVDFTGNEKEQTATLTCVLPEVYTGQTAKYLFAGINLH